MQYACMYGCMYIYVRMYVHVYTMYVCMYEKTIYVRMCVYMFGCVQGLCSWEDLWLPTRRLNP